MADDNSSSPTAGAGQTAPASAKLKIFISYSRQDVAVADELVADLQAAGFDVKIDREHLPFGEKWQKVLAEWIVWADAIVWLVSPRSIGSEWCQWELGEVERLGKRLAPVRVAPVDNQDLPEGIGRVHILPIDGIYAREAHFPQLVQALKTNHEWLQEHTRLVAMAQHWVQRGRPDDQLMSAADIRATGTMLERRPRDAAEAPQIVIVLRDKSRQKLDAEDVRRRRTLGLAYAEPVKTAYRAREHETAIKLAAHGAMLADDLNFSLVPELWDAVAPSIVACPTRARLAGHNKVTTAYAFDGAKRYLITGADDGSINVLDLRTRNCQCRPELHNAQIMTIGISPDGATAVSGSIAGDVIVWRTLDGSTVSLIPLRGVIATNAQWSENGAYLAIGLSVGDSKGKVLLLDGASFATIGSTTELPAIVNAISFNSLATTMAVGLFADRQKVDTAVIAFAVPTMTRQFTVAPHGEKIKQLLFSPCGRFLITNSEQELYFETEDQSVSQSASGRTLPWVQIWSASTGSSGLSLLGHTRVVHDVSFSANGRQLVTSAADGSARLWDIETGNELKRLYRHTQDIYRAVLSSDGQRVATLSDDQSVRIWSAPTGELLREFTDYREVSWSGHAHEVVRACLLFFLDEDRTVCAASAASAPRLIDTAKSFLVAEHWHHDGPVSSVRFSPDAGHVVSIGRRDLISFELGVGTIRSRAYLTHPSITFRQDNLTFYANGQYLAVITDDFRSYSHDVAVQCFDLKAGETVFDADLKDFADHRIVTSHDPAGIAVFQKNGVALWAPTPAERNSLETVMVARQAAIENRAVGDQIDRFWLLPTLVVAKGRVRISAERDGSFTLVEVQTDEKLASMPSSFPVVNGVGQAHGRKITEHPATGLVSLIEYDEQRISTRTLDLQAGTIDEVSFDRPADERRGGDFGWLDNATGKLALSILTKGRSGTPAVGIYDARTGALLIDLPHPARVADAQFHPHAAQVITACDDGGIRIWDVSRAEIALRPQSVVLLAALNHGIGTTTVAERKQLLLRDAPPDLFEAVTNAVGTANAANPVMLEPVMHPACYAPPRRDNFDPKVTWSPFIENRRKQALPTPIFHDSTAKLNEQQFRRTTVFRLADGLTKAALTDYFSSEGFRPATDTTDQSRLVRIDEVLEKATSFAVDLHTSVHSLYANPMPSRPDALAYNPVVFRSGLEGVIKDSAGCEFDRAGVNEVCRRYLEGRLRNHDYDIVLARALTGLEMYQFANSISLERDHGPSRASQFAILTAVAVGMLAVIVGVGFGMRYGILSAVDNGWLGDWARTAADLLAGAFALMAVQTMAAIPVNIAKKFFGKPPSHDILVKMFHAYGEIPEHPPMSPLRLRELIQAAATAGAVWPAGLYRLLDDMQRRETPVRSTVGGSEGGTTIPPRRAAEVQGAAKMPSTVAGA